MWIWCPASIQSPPILLPRQPPPPPLHILPFPPPRSTPSRNLTVSAGENISGLGHSLIAALNTTSNPTPKKQNQDEEEEEEEGRQMSGSDVLWALQRAAATRKSKNTKKRAMPSTGSRRKEDDSDYSNVKPLIVKSEWSSKLDDLEKRLQELSEMV